MHKDLLGILRCPRTNAVLDLLDAEYKEGEIFSGVLVSRSEGHRYYIRKFIPRFVPSSNYAENFGMQWKKFRKTQLDSFSGHPISANRFWKATGWTREQIGGKWVLDVGCGAGRFAEIALNAGAKVVALDFSEAVDACYENLRHFPNLHVIQGDVYALPLTRNFFDFVYSLGVLQHTPDVGKAFHALPPMLKNGGGLCVDFYWKRLRSLLHSKYLFRPVTKRLPQHELFAMLDRLVPILLPISQALNKIPLCGRGLMRAVPVANYTGVLPLDRVQLREWALLDTFDMLAPQYDKPQSKETILRWLREDDIVESEVFHGGHLVGRGFKRP